MSLGPVTPARIDFSDPAVPCSPDFGDIYHARAGARAQASHVFLGGNDLPLRWRGHRRFVILETGFGLGHNFLATWAAWRADPLRCGQLWFMSIERHPPTHTDLRRAHAATPDRALVDALAAQWPPLTPDMHLLSFDGGQVRLLLAWGDVARVMPEWVAEVDAFYLDGFAPDRNPAMWDMPALQRLPRLAAPGATLATWCVARTLRDNLAKLGFEVSKAAGFGGKREMTVARFAPQHRPVRPAGRIGMESATNSTVQVAVVGAGLAGAAVAQALAGHGHAVTVFERQATPAAQASGNPAGLFHSVVHGDDGIHERWFRACALHAERVLRPALSDGSLTGAIDGLLRLETTRDHGSMHRRLVQRGLPADHVRALHPDDASALAGLRLSSPAWYFPGGGWVAPAEWVHQMLHARPLDLRLGIEVAALEPVGARWHLLDAQSRLLMEADAVVLANAWDAPRLLGRPAWPLQRVRGQVTRVHRPGPLWWPRRPITGHGYAIGLPNGDVLCGATSQLADDDGQVREDDHHANLNQWVAVVGHETQAPGVIGATGRVGWRLQAADRLPLVGPVPQEAVPAGARADQPRLLPRRAGLYVLAALGSRGITQAALAGEVLASWLSGAPVPAPASLLDAVDPARFAARALRAGHS